jgi:hypothetical protein
VEASVPDAGDDEAASASPESGPESGPESDEVQQRNE